MKQYLLSVYQPEGPTPPAEFLDQVMRDLDQLNREMREAGAWVFSGGLHSPDTATVLRHQDGETLLTDGPFAEGKEYLGGFTIVRAADLDAALDWGRRLARATTLPIEVRPFFERPGSAERSESAGRPESVGRSESAGRPEWAESVGRSGSAGT